MARLNANMLGGLNKPLLQHLRDIYTVTYGFMLRVNGRSDYPHLLTVFLFGMVLNLNVTALLLYTAYFTGWDIGPLLEQPEALTAIGFVVPFAVYALWLRGRDHDAELERLRASDRAKSPGGAFLLYLAGSFVALCGAFALYIHKSSA